MAEVGGQLASDSGLATLSCPRLSAVAARIGVSSGGGDMRQQAVRKEMSMWAIIAFVVFGCAAAAGSAQAGQYEPGPSTAPAQPTALKTGKERLGEKATDEQRVDDCKVPSGRRTRERPAACPWDVESQARVSGDAVGMTSMRHLQAEPGR
jgi:hypothetical protein